MSARTGFMLASIVNSVLWVALIILPVFWLFPPA